MYSKQIPFRSEKWLQAVRALGECVNCGCNGVQAAHRNEGKGMGMKVSDCLSAALCPVCHSRIDQGMDMTREQRRAEMDRAIVLTLEKLVKSGKVIVL
jgi:ferredoxin